MMKFNPIVFSLTLLSCLPLTAQSFPGSGEDFDVRIAVGTSPLIGQPSSTVAAAPGSVFQLVALSPSHSADLHPFFIFGELLTATPASPNALYPNAWVGHGGLAAVFAIVDRGVFVNDPILLPGGNSYGWTIPPGLTGLHLMLQGIALTSTAMNGVFYLSAGREVVFVP